MVSKRHKKALITYRANSVHAPEVNGHDGSKKKKKKPDVPNSTPSHARIAVDEGRDTGEPSRQDWSSLQELASLYSSMISLADLGQSPQLPPSHVSSEVPPGTNNNCPLPQYLPPSPQRPVKRENSVSNKRKCAEEDSNKETPKNKKRKSQQRAVVLSRSVQRTFSFLTFANATQGLIKMPVPEGKKFAFRCLACSFDRNTAVNFYSGAGKHERTACHLGALEDWHASQAIEVLRDLAKAKEFSTTWDEEMKRKAEIWNNC
ncbi:hypothetical protein IAR50_002830 [Cryptococcus sp. DSM 104548]